MDGKCMRCPGSVYEFTKHFQQTHSTLILGIQNAHQWDASTWNRFNGILLRSFKGQILLLLDSKPIIDTGLHLLFEQVIVKAASSSVLLGKLLSKLTRMGLLIDGDLVKQLLVSIAHSGISFDSCCTQLKVRMLCPLIIVCHIDSLLSFWTNHGCLNTWCGWNLDFIAE